jgi:eukaryotic-like serine/threonine-protein kinase
MINTDDEPTRPVAAEAAGGADDKTVVGTAGGTGANSASPPKPDASTAYLQNGQLLGHTYEIEARLARGGMGEVYRARHVELNSRHAIKVILPELADDPHVVTMFTEEARKLRMVRHDAVVAYDGMFRDEKGLRYLVMEFVDGIPLARVLRERRLSLDEIRTLRGRLAQGLAAAHDKLIFHRDISPDNIILVDGQVELAKIIDFGIAKSAGAGERTIIGSDFAGKYSYVSPEQLGMFGGTVDARSDVYSLGLVLVAAALGQKLDMGDSPVSVITARQKVPDLSALALELRSEIEPMLAPDPKDRPASMRELPGSAVSADARGHTVFSSPSPPAPSIEAPGPRRRPWFVPAMAGVVALLATTGIGYFLLPNASETKTPVTVEPAVTANRDAMAAQVQQAASLLRCAGVNAELGDDNRIKLSGFVATPQDEADLRRSLAGQTGIQGVTGEVAIYPWPQCEVAGFLQNEIPGADPKASPHLTLNNPTHTYEAGSLLIVHATQAAASDGFLYVDGFDNEGHVFHMFPSPQRPNNKVRAGADVTLGDPHQPGIQNPRTYDIEEPFGPNLIVAISSPRPLFDQRPAEDEQASVYIPVLKKAIAAAIAAKQPVASTLAPFNTVARGKP